MIVLALAINHLNIPKKDIHRKDLMIKRLFLALFPSHHNLSTNMA